MAKHNLKFNLTEVQRLTPEGFQHTTVDMWRKFCRHMVDIENDYFDKDGLVDDMVDEIIIECDGDEMEDEDEDDLLDEDDRHLIDMALQLSQQNETNTTESTTNTNSQHNLTDMDPSFIENMDPNFLDCILPLHALHTK